MDCTTREGRDGVRHLVREAIESGLTTQQKLAKRVAVPSSSISEFLNDKWPGSPGKEVALAIKLAKSVNQLNRDADAGDSGVGSFVEIRVAEQIYAMAAHILTNKAIGCFVMAAGNGKTMTLEALKEENPGAVLLTARGVTATRRQFLRYWCAQLGLPVTGAAQELQHRIVARLSDSGRLQLIDEAHKLSTDTLDTIREVWDEARCPILLAATPTFMNTMLGARGESSSGEILDQFFSRIGIFRNYTRLEDPETGVPQKLISVEDIRKIFHRGRVRLTSEAARFLCLIANFAARGGLRACRNMVTICDSARPGMMIDVPMLESALGQIVGGDEARTWIAQARIEEGVMESAGVAATA